MRFLTAFSGLIALSCAALAAACGSSNGSDEPTCLPAPASTTCTPLYEPTFDNVFMNTLSTTCAATGCHSGAQPTGNMALDEIEKAYTNITAKSTTGEPRIEKGNVQCGKVIVRLESKDKSYSMPPQGATLRDGEVCSIAQWIAMGAKR